MPKGRHEAISPTAHYTAYVWHRLGLPYADLFATRKGAALYWGGRAAGEWMTEFSKAVPSLWQYLGHRHLLIDAKLRELEPDLIVELGAGLSRRGITWALDHDVKYIEVDLPDMSAAKRELIEASTSAIVRATLLLGRLVLTSRNILSPNFAYELQGLLVGAARPVVISEGVIMYFDFEDRVTLLNSIARALRARDEGHYLCDLQTRDREHEAGRGPDLLRRGIKLVTGGRGVAPGWEDWAHVENFFKDRGFDELRALDAKDYLQQSPGLSKMRSPGTLVWASVDAKNDLSRPK